MCGAADDCRRNNTHQPHPTPNSLPAPEVAHIPHAGMAANARSEATAMCLTLPGPFEKVYTVTPTHIKPPSGVFGMCCFCNQHIKFR